MRFQVEPYKSVGDTRVITRFLFFPRRIGNEARWLEKARIRQVAVRCEYSVHWYDERWEDD